MGRLSGILRGRQVLKIDVDGDGTDFMAHFFDGKKIVDIPMEHLKEEMKGADPALAESWEKCFSDKPQKAPATAVQEVPIAGLAAKYGLQVETMTYEQSLTSKPRP